MDDQIRLLEVAAHKEYLDSIAEWKVGDGYKVPGEFVVAGGRR
jgi:hypothetical protein